MLLLALVAPLPLGCTGAEGRRGGTGADRSPVVTVAAAADLRAAFAEMAEALAARGLRVRLTFGSSGLLARQILQGAPFDLFASADVSRVEEVIRAGRGVAASRAVYAHGRLVLYTRPGLKARRRVADLADPGVTRLALANPAHAPYGVAARQVLASAGLEERLAGRLVFGDDVAATLALARTGNADVAIVARSLVGADDRDRWAPIPTARHRPIRQALVVTAPPGPRRVAAARVARYVRSRAGQAILARHGFEPPVGAPRSPAPRPAPATGPGR